MIFLYLFTDKTKILKTKTNYLLKCCCCCCCWWWWGGGGREIGWGIGDNKVKVKVKGQNKIKNVLCSGEALNDNQNKPL